MYEYTCLSLSLYIYIYIYIYISIYIYIYIYIVTYLYNDSDLKFYMCNISKTTSERRRICIQKILFFFYLSEKVFNFFVKK